MPQHPSRPFDTDVLIIGAGPSITGAGANAADRGSIRSIVLDAQDAATLRRPAPDGRDIALTHRAAAVMRRLGTMSACPPPTWRRCQAEVYNGRDPAAARFRPAGLGRAELGWLVANRDPPRQLGRCRTTRQSRCAQPRVPASPGQRRRHAALPRRSDRAGGDAARAAAGGRRQPLLRGAPPGRHRRADATSAAT